jgi:hypothetical protein
MRTIVNLDDDSHGGGIASLQFAVSLRLYGGVLDSEQGADRLDSRPEGIILPIDMLHLMKPEAA